MTMRLREWDLSEVTPDVQIVPGAAYWTVESRANAPEGFIAFSASSQGEFLFHTLIPRTISATPSLSYALYVASNSSAANYLLYAKSLMVQSGQASSPASTSWIQTTTTSFAANGAAYQEAQYILPNSMGLAAPGILKVVIGRQADNAGDNVSVTMNLIKATVLAYIDDSL